MRRRPADGTHEGALLVAILAAALAIRLPFVAFDPGVIADPALISGWAQTLARGGGAELLASTGDLVLYPPLSMLTLWVAGAIGALVGGPFMSPATVSLALIKAIAMVSDIALAAVVARMLAGRSVGVRIGATAAIAFNPALWYLSTIWGQIDSTFVLLMVVSVAAMHGQRFVAGWLAWAASVAWKLQSLVLGPVVLIGTLRRRGIREAIVGTAGAALLAAGLTAILLPIDRWGEYAARLSRPESNLVVSGFNLWFLLPSVDSELGGQIGYVALAMITLVVGAQMWRRAAAVGLALPALTLALAAFVWLPAMHERYLIGALPFAVLLAAGLERGRPSRGAIVVAVAITATQALNLVAVGSFAPSLWTNVTAPGGGTGPLAEVVRGLGYACAAINVAVLGWAVWRVVVPADDG